MQTFKELIVWQKSRFLAKSVYELCKLLPSNELYGIASQMKRCSVSIPSNIAEGYRRKGKNEYLQFLGIATGSAAELETQLILTSDIFSLDTNDLQLQVIEVQKIISAIINKLQN